jgi:protein TonB
MPALSRTSERVKAPEVKHAIAIAEMKAPKAKASPTRVSSADPPPMMVSTSENITDTPGSALLLGSAVAAVPAPPKTVTGGQLQPPRLITSTSPVYPQTARLQRLQGVVTLDALVDESGKVVQTQVLSGPMALQAAAQEAVHNWRYQPAQLNGKAISVHTRVSVNFALQ